MKENQTSAVVELADDFSIPLRFERTPKLQICIEQLIQKIRDNKRAKSVHVSLSLQDPNLPLVGDVNILKFLLLLIRRKIVRNVLSSLRIKINSEGSKDIDWPIPTYRNDGIQRLCYDGVEIEDTDISFDIVRIPALKKVASAILSQNVNVITEFSLADAIESKTRAIKPRVKFNSESGIGYVDGNRFQFRRGSNTYKLFAACFANIGKAVERGEVVRLVGLLKAGDSDYVRVKRANETREIGKIVEKVRNSTGLSSDQFLQNGGSVLLDAVSDTRVKQG